MGIGRDLCGQAPLTTWTNLGNDDTSKKFMGHRVCRKRGEGQEETPRGEEERSGQGGMLIAIIKYIWEVFTISQTLSFFFFFI